MNSPFTSNLTPLAVCVAAWAAWATARFDAGGRFWRPGGCGDEPKNVLRKTGVRSHALTPPTSCRQPAIAGSPVRRPRPIFSSVGRSGATAPRSLQLEDLERRLLLSSSGAGSSYPAYIMDPTQATTPLEQASPRRCAMREGPTLTGNDGPLEKIGPNLAEVYEEYRLSKPGEPIGPSENTFTPSNSEIQVSGSDVAVDAIASGDVGRTPVGTDRELGMTGARLRPTRSCRAAGSDGPVRTIFRRPAV